jgi:hypothetical protein
MWLTCRFAWFAIRLAFPSVQSVQSVVKEFLLLKRYQPVLSGTKRYNTSSEVQSSAFTRLPLQIQVGLRCPSEPLPFPRKKYSLLNRNVPLLNRNLASKPERKPVWPIPQPALGAPNSDSPGVRLTSQPGFRPPVPPVPFFPCVAFPLRTHFFKKYPGLSCISHY